MGNYYNFTERWNKRFEEEKDKTFSLKKKQTEIKFVIYETQAREQERTVTEDGSILKTESKEVQAKKSTRGMPWHQEPKKDATSCDKL